MLCAAISFLTRAMNLAVTRQNGYGDASRERFPRRLLLVVISLGPQPVPDNITLAIYLEISWFRKAARH
jgi:hypothetical protein